MRTQRFQAFVALKPRLLLMRCPLFACLLLGACASPQSDPPVEVQESSPGDVQLTLNLPEGAEVCVCESHLENDRTFLERGIEVLASGDYIEAVQYFQRYQRLEKSPLAQWEAELSIAYVSMLPSSPFYDVQATRSAYQQLQASEPAGQKHPSVVLMQQALESFVLMDRHVQDLERRASILQEDLDKRELALKRLRELTLGQPEGGP